jgi:nuclear GTP-binding protein
VLGEARRRGEKYLGARLLCLPRSPRFLALWSRITHDARTKQTTGSSTKALSSSSTGASGGVSLKRVKGENFYRNAKDARRLKLLTGGKPIRDKQGVIIQAAEYQKGEDETKPGRVAPDRRWFGV